MIKKLEEKVKELESEIARRKLTEARQATQFTLTNIFAEYASLHAVAPRVLQSICEGFGWVLGELWRVDRKANLLRLESLWHIPALNACKFEELSRLTTFSPGVGLPGRVWTNGQSVTWVADVVMDDNFLRASIAGELGLHGAMAFPIRKIGNVIGVMVFFSEKILPLDKELLDVMADIGLRVGTFINRKLSDDQLRESERRYRLLFENLPQKIFLKDKNSVYVYCNENYARELKIRADEIAGKSDYDFFPKELAEKYREDDRKVLESGKQEKFREPPVRGRNEVCVFTIKTPLKDEKGNVVGIVGILLDIPD